jgi:hypothetical protein
MSNPTAPASTSPLAHVKRAFGWNLARVLPSAAESSALGEAGITEPTAQRYAVWRRSLLLVALVPTLLVAGLALWDLAEAELEGVRALGLALEAAWLVVLVVLPLALLRGIIRWRRPEAGARLLFAAWLAAFLLPVLTALIPEEALSHIDPVEASPIATAVVEATGAVLGEDLTDVDVEGKTAAVQELTLKLVVSSGAFLMLLPALISLIPGAINACLRVKTLLPGAQLPGWLLTAVAPMFLLFWLVMLVLVNPAVQGPWLVLGLVLWAGSPFLYTLRGRDVVHAQPGSEGIARVARVKRTVTVVALAGIACLVTFLLTTKVVGLSVLGEDPERAFDTRVEEGRDEDGVLGWEAVREAYEDSEALVFALDPGWLQLLLDILAKLLISTAVFAGLVLRATLAAWKDEGALRREPGVAEHDQAAAATLAALRG